MEIARNPPIIMKHPRGVHSTPSELKKPIKRIEGLEGVNRVIVGPSRCTTHGFSMGHIKFTRKMTGGIKANGYSSRGVTELYVYCDDEEAIKQDLCNKECPKKKDDKRKNNGKKIDKKKPKAYSF